MTQALRHRRPRPGPRSRFNAAQCTPTRRRSLHPSAVVITKRHRLPDSPTYYAPALSNFRKKYGDAPGPPRPGYVPDRGRFATAKIVKRNFDLLRGRYTPTSQVWDDLLEYLRAPAQASRLEADSVVNLLMSADWLHFYEAVEFLATRMRAMGDFNGPDSYELFRGDVNAVWVDEAVAYELTDAGEVIQRVSSEFVEASEAALELANRSELEAQQRQLLDAHEKLKLRKLDPPGAVLLAVGALEGVARSVLGKTSGNLSKNADQLRQRLHPALVQLLTSLEGYRGDVAAQHDARPGKLVTEQEAIFAIHVCSAAVVLLLETTNPERKP